MDASTKYRKWDRKWNKQFREYKGSHGEPLKFFVNSKEFDFVKEGVEEHNKILGDDVDYSEPYTFRAIPIEETNGQTRFA
jgi:hypothetical protein